MRLDLTRPAHLDMAINGVKVFIYRRPDESAVYASIHAFTDVQVKPLRIMRVPIDYAGDPEQHPDVVKAVAAFQKADWMEPNWT